MNSAAAACLLLIPLSELVKRFVDFVLLHMKKPVHVPRLALSGGIPPEGRTLCVVSALLSSAEHVAPLVDAIEKEV